MRILAIMLVCLSVSQCAGALQLPRLQVSVRALSKPPADVSGPREVLGYIASSFAEVHVG